MKTMLRILAVGAGVFGLAWCLGTHQDEAKADTPAGLPATPALEPAAPAAADNPLPVGPAQPDAAETPAVIGTNALSMTNAAAFTNADALKLSTNLITGPMLPESLKLSQPLNDIVKLVHAGVSEQVLLAFIAAATEPFEAGSAEIIYLHDIGLGPSVITALLQHDSTPEMQARRQANNAVKPLPPGVGLTTPATNIYTPKETLAAPANPPEPQPVGLPEGASDSAATPPAQPVANPEVEQYDGSPAVTSVSYNYWYSSLAPYGSWVTVGGYGPCWRPTVAVCNSAWKPYGDCGRWLWTDAGWYWYSDYSWGWGPFHYGRWFCPPGIGWVWAPGRIWSPAWVSWRYTPSYCGWAPLPPAACYSRRSGFYFNAASVGIGCDFGLSASAYVFLPLNRFCDRRPYHYYVSGRHAQAIHRDSTVINNYVVGDNNTIINRGIGVDRVAQATRGPIRPVPLRDAATLPRVGPRGEQLTSDGVLAVRRPDQGTITRRGMGAPAPGAIASPAVFRPRNDRSPADNVNPGLAPVTPNSGNALPRFDRPRLGPSTPQSPGVANDLTARRPGSIFLSRPNASTPVRAFPGTVGNASQAPSRPRNGQGPTVTGNATPSTSVGQTTKPIRPPLVMRNPNPSRNGVNRPVTYPFVPSTGQVRPESPPANPSRPSFVPRPPANVSRPSHTPSVSRAVASVTQARPSLSLPSAGTAPRAQIAQPAVSAPSHSQASARSSSGGSSRGGASVSRGVDRGNVGGRR